VVAAKKHRKSERTVSSAQIGNTFSDLHSNSAQLFINSDKAVREAFREKQRTAAGFKLTQTLIITI
jgi:hypothetical protein